ncbi:MAG: putative oxidoreductase [Modestobacter sp.]|nr:putative oxidoreductase [Modestobacter sp.]MCW2617783.1 putative oxidoreductase [Modestobacter sp.]
MKAMQFARTGTPDVLHLADVPEPHAGRGQVRIAVRAAGVNPVDWKIRGGSTLGAVPVPLPSVPGLEAAGIIDEVGPGVEGVRPGDAVFGATERAAAEFAVLTHWAVKPEGMSFAEAAGIPMAAETAQRGLSLLQVGTGDTLLVNGAAGGVGVAAVQLALARGAEVVGTASAANQEFLASLGARATTYGTGLADRVRALVPRGVNRALDVAGSGVIPELVRLTGSPDRVVSIGDATATGHGVRFTTGAEGRFFSALGLAASLASGGRFTMPVAQTWPLDQLAEAHRFSEGGHVRGKLVVVLD